MAAKLTDVRPEFVIAHCDKCATPYDTRKTRATLRFTYCSSMCESAALGFDIDHATRKDAVWAHAPKIADPAVAALIAEALAATDSDSGKELVTA